MLRGVVLAAVFGCTAANGPTSAGERRVSLTNLTGERLAAVYLSRHGAPTWEENVLGDDALSDGTTVAIGIGDTASRWDLRVDAAGHRYHSEWRDLDFRAISAITLRVDRQCVVAELAPFAPAMRDGRGR
jgi:hypothetical protein